MPEKNIIGKFGSVYGVKGWLKVISFTDPKENILEFTPWFINKANQWQSIAITDSRIHGKNIIVKIANVDERELAKTYTNLEIATADAQLPKLPQGEYYWSDLEGLTVINKDDKNLGQVDHILATGANDVLVIKNHRERLIPYIDNVILNIDLTKKIITVDWDTEF